LSVVIFGNGEGATDDIQSHACGTKKI